jgi:hypothetical protein
LTKVPTGRESKLAGDAGRQFWCESVWSKYSCGPAVVILQEAAQSLFAAHAACTAADYFLLPWKQQNVSSALMVPLLKEMRYIFSDRSAQRTLTKQHQLR